MHVIILCGGSGDRMQGYSLPKPLNMIWAKPAIYYTLYHLPEEVHTLHFILSSHLDDFNFEPTVRNQFRKKTCYFYRLPYFTRGPIESAILGIQELCRQQHNTNLNEPVVFLDNDVYYKFPEGFFSSSFSSHFLGYCKDTSGSEAYSFVKLENTNIVEIQEKKRISDLFCCGIYGFASISSFLLLAQEFCKEHHEQEYYMSCLFQQCIAKKQSITGILFPNVCHLGSLMEVEQNIGVVPMPKLRICFDLDNTLVTYPYSIGDYTSVKPVSTMVTLARELHAMGHTIIIYTARRMETHKYNVGAVIKDIAKDTITTLETLEIPYDELLFGKPLADIYIDDRAVNPFRNDFSSMGLLNVLQPSSVLEPVNKLPNNKYNKVIVKGQDVMKIGPLDVLKGEIAFYQSIPQEKSCIDMFPKYRSSCVDGGQAKLCLEYVKGIPLYHLYRAELLTEDIVKQLFVYLDLLHNVEVKNQIKPTVLQLQSNYIAKLKRRFAETQDYPFDKEQVRLTQEASLCALQSYCDSLQLEKNIVSMIHGDFWFSNIILEFKKQIKSIDMKGHLDGFITTAGDLYYDYGKLYQSFLGYDLALYGHSIDELYQANMKDAFESECVKRHICIKTLRGITFGLVMGTLHAIDEMEKKIRVWNWIQATFMN
jgi:capsule biosynthesis phosphatase